MIKTLKTFRSPTFEGQSEVRIVLCLHLYCIGMKTHFEILCGDPESHIKVTRGHLRDLYLPNDDLFWAQTYVFTTYYAQKVKNEYPCSGVYVVTDCDWRGRLNRRAHRVTQWEVHGYCSVTMQTSVGFTWTALTHWRPCGWYYALLSTPLIS